MTAALRAIRARAGKSGSTANRLTSPDAGVWFASWPKDAAGNVDPTAWPTFSGGETGKGVVIGLFDTGIDVAFPGFHQAKTVTDPATKKTTTTSSTRIAALWDMSKDWKAQNARTGAARIGVDPTTMGGRHYGWVYRDTDIQSYLNDLADGKTTGTFESQDYNGHGTSVACMAASHGAPSGHKGQEVFGAAPEATLVICKRKDECDEVGKIYSGGGGAGKSVDYEAQINDFIDFVAHIANGKPYVVSFSIAGLEHFSWPVTSSTIYPGGRYENLRRKISAAKAPPVVWAAGNNGVSGSCAEFAVPTNSKREITFGFQTYDTRDALTKGACSSAPFTFANSASHIEYVYVPTSDPLAFEVDFYRTKDRFGELTSLGNTRDQNTLKPNASGQVSVIDFDSVATASTAGRVITPSYADTRLGNVGGVELRLLRIRIRLSVFQAGKQKSGKVFKPDFLFVTVRLPATASATRSSNIMLTSTVMSKYGARILADHFKIEHPVTTGFDPVATRVGAALSTDRKNLINSEPAIDEIITVGASDYGWPMWMSQVNGSPAKDGFTVTPKNGKAPDHRVSAFSSRGPLWRDSILLPTERDVQKPDIAAPGTVLHVASPQKKPSFGKATAKSTSSSPSKFAAKQLYGVQNHEIYTSQGTSLAAPMMAGVIALMLEKKPNLTSSQIKTALTTSATQPSGSGFNGDLGFGVVDAVKAMDKI